MSDPLLSPFSSRGLIIGTTHGYRYEPQVLGTIFQNDITTSWYGRGVHLHKSNLEWHPVKSALR
jgi:hypothetical protein